MMICSLQMQAQWTTDPAVNTPVCTTPGTHQMFPQIASDENGGAFVVWVEAAADMMSTRIFAQHLSPAGTKLWAAGGIEATNASGLFTSPQIVADGAGGAVISWINNPSGIIQYYMQRISATGQTQWTAGGVLVSDVVQVSSFNYQMIGDGLGGASLLWDDSRGGNVRVYAQHIDAAGNRLWANDGLPISPEFTDFMSSDAVADKEGGIFLCFGKNSGLLNLHEVYVQHINADGIAEWGNDGLNLSNVSRDQLFCKIAKDTSDHVIVVWQDFRLDPAWSQIYGQRIDSVGNLQWGPNGKLLADSVVPDYTWTKIVSDSKKGVVITWFDNYDPIQTSDTAHLYAIRIDSTGSVVWTKKEVVNWHSGQVPNEYELVADYKGGAYTSFAKDPNIKLGAQHILPDGSLEFPLAGTMVSSAPQLKAWQQLMCDSNGLAVVVWTDLRSATNYDLYAMRIGAPVALPVTWVHFTGKPSATSIILTWQTAQEENNKGFAIQRSSNGNLFDSIGYKAAGSQYSFIDVSPLQGDNYYRLQQMDIDGEISYSRVVRVNMEKENWLRLFPNPARDKIIVSGFRPGSRLVIYDGSGRIMKRANVREIYVGDLPAGIYYLVDESRKNPAYVFLKK